MDSRRDECAHWPVPPVRIGNKYRKVQSMTCQTGTLSNQDVGGGGGMPLHRKGGDVLKSIDNMDTLPGLPSETYHRFDDGAQTVYA